MPARDIFHDAVKVGLEKEGWIITADPLWIKVEDSEGYVDLAAEKMIAAQKGTDQMDKLDEYRTHVQELLKWYGSFKPMMKESVSEYERQIIFDRENDHYQIVDVGWDHYNRIHHCVLHLDIKDEKIWVQEDMTDPGIVGRLMDRGVPKDDIVLAFHAPYKRPYTGFAIA